MILEGCTIVVLVGGGFVEHTESPNVHHLRDAGARVIEQGYPVHSVPAAYASVVRPNSVLLGESAGGTIAAWAAARGRARAAVTVGAPFDFTTWYPDHPAVHGHPWKWSPRRVYRGQRPLTAIHWTLDLFVPADQSRLRGARRVLLEGVGHTSAPRRILVRELKRACETGPATRAGAPRRVPSPRRRTSGPSPGSR